MKPFRLPHQWAWSSGRAAHRRTGWASGLRLGQGDERSGGSWMERPHGHWRLRSSGVTGTDSGLAPARVSPEEANASPDRAATDIATRGRG